jgi:uncharacterized protein (DUF58 family)
MSQVLKPSALLVYWVAGLAGIALMLGTANALGYALSTLWSSLLQGAMVAVAGFALVDAIRLVRRPSPRVRRHIQGSMALGRWSEVRLDVEHDLSYESRIVLFDHPAEGLEFEHLPQTITVKPGATARIGYRVRPVCRGPLLLEHCEVQLPGPMGLWWSRRYLPLNGATRVYPDFAQLYSGKLPAVDALLGRIGIRLDPRRGMGQEFHQLREFREGDNLRQIDWKATARQRKPIAREYQDERDQQIIFLLDCGRRMRSQDGDLSHFDHALNACLLLSHIALRQGDAVGLSTFAAEVDRHLPPLKGQGQLRRLLDTTYDLNPTRRAADHANAVQQLLARQKRRAFVVLLTNLRDEEEEDVLNATKRMSKRHRVLVVSLREEMLDRVRQSDVQTYNDALTYCAALDLINARAALQDRLEAQGVPVLDARPAELGPELIARYLRWKKAGTL